jgi:hypothetical protein
MTAAKNTGLLAKFVFIRSHQNCVHQNVHQNLCSSEAIKIVFIKMFIETCVHQKPSKLCSSKWSSKLVFIRSYQNCAHQNGHQNLCSSEATWALGKTMIDVDM